MASNKSRGGDDNNRSIIESMIYRQKRAKEEKSVTISRNNGSRCCFSFQPTGYRT